MTETILTVRDEGLPAAGVLLGREAVEVLGVAVAAGGGRLRSVRARQVHYQPGRRLTVQYRGKVQGPRGATSEESLVAVTDIDGPPAGSLVLEADGAKVGVWRLPHDPLLPGLESALDPAEARELMGGGPGPVSVSLRRYRPGRRAVVQAKSGDRMVYMKVVRPERAARLRQCHEQLAPTIPVPRPIGGDEAAGVIVVEQLPGRSLAAALIRGDPVPNAGQLVGLLDELAAVELDRDRRPTSTDSARAHASTLAAIVPSEQAHVDRLVDALGQERQGPLQTGHGDFYDAQVLLTDGHISGLIDVDGAGPIERVEELANLLGHLSALALWQPRVRERVDGYCAELVDALESMADPMELHRRAAAVVLGLATGPFRGQRPNWEAETREHIDLVERWIDSAQAFRRSRR